MTEIENNERIVMLLSIIQRGKGAQYIKGLKDHGLYLNYQCIGSGTASSEMMDILGLGSNDKDIMLSFGTLKAVNNLCGEFSKLVGSSTGYGGIAMVISPSAFSKITSEIIKRNSKDIEKGDGKNMHSEFAYSLILISINRGFTDAVMQTAKKAGATGGTARRLIGAPVIKVNIPSGSNDLY